MRINLVAGALLAFLPLFNLGSASAADLSEPAVAMPVGNEAPPTWSGFYFGLHGGGGSATSDTCVEYNSANGPYDPCAPFDDDANAVKMTGPYVGAQVGYNFLKAGGLLLGVEADINWAGLDGDAPQAFTPGVSSQTRESIDSFGTVRGRLGYVMGNWMPYITGGWAFGTGSRTASTIFGTDHSNGTHSGWTIGGGAEWAINQHWSLKGEYKYIDLGRADYQLDDIVDSVFGIDVKMHTFEVGLNYRW